jgi:hypothetical protein
MGVRSIYIPTLAFVCILVPGGVLLRHSEAGSFAVEFLAFAVGFTVFHVLEGRERRRRQSRD